MKKAILVLLVIVPAIIALAAEQAGDTANPKTHMKQFSCRSGKLQRALSHSKWNVLIIC
jgi:hypothetical protein